MNWPTGLAVHEALTSVKDGNASLIDVQVTNNTDHNIILPGSTVLGRLQLVHLVTPVEVKLTDPVVMKGESPVAPCQTDHRKTAPADHRESCASELPTETDFCKVTLPDVDISGLTPDQQEKAKQLLREEADAFAKDENDIGTAPDLQMDINLTSSEPVQKNYLSIYIVLCTLKLRHMLKTFQIEASFVSQSRHSQAVLYTFERMTEECDYVLITES